jgi:hypothetical protein
MITFPIRNDGFELIFEQRDDLYKHFLSLMANTIRSYENRETGDDTVMEAPFSFLISFNFKLKSKERKNYKNIIN